MNSFRTGRVGSLIQEKIGLLIVEGKIKDPRVDSFLSVTRVDVSRDLSWADVFVSSHKTGEGLAKAMHIRSTPRLRFHVDLGVRKGFEMLKKLEDLDTSAGS
jgi:ribosome-binding factor A